MGIKEIIDFSQTNAGWDLIKALFNYYGLKDYLSFQYYETFEEEKITDIYAHKIRSFISGDQVFWQRIMTGNLLEGDKIRLFNFQVSSWFPRKPGMYWTHGAALARKRALKHHIEKINNDGIVFDVWGKTLMAELGGIGSVKIRKNRNKVLFTLCAAGETDQGIPVICSPEIWNELNNAINKYELIEADVKGVIKPLPTEYDSFLLRSSGLPKVVLSVDSILNVKKKASNVPITVCPWTIFETRNNSYPYGFTYVTHCPSTDDYHAAVEWIRDYVEQHDGTAILTDFDEEINSLNSIFPLNSCLNGGIGDKDILRYCQQIEQKFKQRGY